MRRPQAGVWTGAALGAALGACAPSPSPSRPGRTSEGMLRTTGSYSMEMNLNRSDLQLIDTLDFGAERAWAELPAVFKALGLPVNGADPRARTLMVNAFRPRRIDGLPLSYFLDCGRGVTAGEYADSYQVHLSLETRLVPSAGEGQPSRSTVASTVTANARPRAVSGNPVACQSLGRLEQRVTELLEQRLAGAAGG